MVKPFVMDGVEYNINVMSLTRSFSVLDTDKSGRTQDGEMFRDVIGTFYNYTMVVRAKREDTASFDAFWEAVSQPQTSHLCTFPYNQTVLTQRMYVTSGEQDVDIINNTGTHWGEMTVNFVAMSPRVRA